MTQEHLNMEYRKFLRQSTLSCNYLVTMSSSYLFRCIFHINILHIYTFSHRYFSRSYLYLHFNKKATHISSWFIKYKLNRCIKWHAWNTFLWNLIAIWKYSNKIGWIKLLIKSLHYLFVKSNITVSIVDELKRKIDFDQKVTFQLALASKFIINEFLIC